MDEKIKLALVTDRLVDFTTTGRKTGRAHRIEISFHYLDGKIYLCGMPDRKKDWYANLLADPHITIHFKESLSLDVPAFARTVRDSEQRRSVLAFIITTYQEKQDLETWVQGATLVEVELDTA